jgi:ribosomal protein S18 acetylase RimI-like enzyme
LDTLNEEHIDMTEQAKMTTTAPVITVEFVTDSLETRDLNDLCDSTDAAIKSGGGFGWVELPARDILERFWQGVITMPGRFLFVARLDGVICGTCQLIKPPANNEAQAHAVQLTTTFVAPWARGHGIAQKLIEKAERIAQDEGFAVINLDVRETMQEAISLYEKLGYERYATHPDYARIKGKTIKGYFYYKTL